MSDESANVCASVGKFSILATCRPQSACKNGNTRQKSNGDSLDLFRSVLTKKTLFLILPFLSSIVQPCRVRIQHAAHKLVSSNFSTHLGSAHKKQAKARLSNVVRNPSVQNLSFTITWFKNTTSALPVRKACTRTTRLRLNQHSNARTCEQEVIVLSCHINDDK